MRALGAILALLGALFFLVAIDQRDAGQRIRARFVVIGAALLAAAGALSSL